MASLFIRHFFTIFHFLITLISFASADQQPTNWTEISSRLRQKFEEFKKFVIVPLQHGEIFCNCTQVNCDTEVTDVVGDEFIGVCRPQLGGVCRRSEQYDRSGNIVKTSFSCVHPHQLWPPERPFICQNIKSAKFTQIERCCNSSFCTSFTDDHDDDGNGVPVLWYTSLFIFIGSIILIATAIGIYHFRYHIPIRKYFAPEPSRSRASTTDSSRSVNRPNETGLNNMEMNKLLQSLDPSTGAGMPMLAQRTIARQIALGELIGQGRFGQVSVGEWRGEKVAVKIFNSRDETSWKRETEIYGTNMLRHSNLLRWIASDSYDDGTSTQLWLVTEYIPNGSLFDYLVANEISMTIGLQFIRSIANGLTYLHTNVPGASESFYKPGVAHCDMKSRNILIKNDMTCVIADLGMAVRDEHVATDMPPRPCGGTVRYLAPEILSDTVIVNSFNSYKQMDVYSFALIIWETCRRISCKERRVESLPYEVPYFEFVKREPELEDMRMCVVQENRHPTIPPNWNNSPIMTELSRIIRESWNANPNSRLPSLNIRYSLDKLVADNNLQIVT